MKGQVIIMYALTLLNLKTNKISLINFVNSVEEAENTIQKFRDKYGDDKLRDFRFQVELAC